MPSCGDQHVYAEDAHTCECGESFRFISSVRLCCLGGVCDRHLKSEGPWIPGPKDLAVFRD